MAIFYATPIVYPLALVPEPYRGWLALNPLAYVVARYRDLSSGRRLAGRAISRCSPPPSPCWRRACGSSGAFRPYFEDLL